MMYNNKPVSILYPWINSMADIYEIVLLSQVVCTGPTHPFSLDDRFRCFPCYTAAVPHTNLYVKLYPCSPPYYTKSVVVDIGPQSSNYLTKFLQYRPRRVFMSGEIKMTNVTISYYITACRTMTNTLSHAFKRGQQLSNLQTYSSEEPTDTVQWQNVKSVGLTPPYMTSGIT